MKYNRVIIGYAVLMLLSIVNIACEGDVATSTRSVPRPQQTDLIDSSSDISQTATRASEDTVQADPYSEPTSQPDNPEVSIPVAEATATPSVSDPISPTVTATPSSNALVQAVPTPSSAPNPTPIPSNGDPASNPVDVSVPTAAPTPTALTTDPTTATVAPTPSSLQLTTYPPDLAPIVSIGPLVPQVSIVGQPVRLSNAISSVPVSGRSMTAAVDWGDGSGYMPVTIIQATGEIIASHTYYEAGSFTVTLRVAIELGGVSIDSMPVVVKLSPTVTPTPTIVVPPTPVPTPSPTWESVGSMVTNQRDHTATLLSNGKVLIIGNYATHLGPSSKFTELYDPSTSTFSATGNISKSHGSHSTATLLADGRVLIAGGVLALTTAEIYDPTTGTFSTTGSLNVGRFSHAAVLLADGRVLVAGGYNSFYDGQRLASAEIFDPATGIFSLTDSLSTDRSAFTATLLPNSQVLIVGGTSDEAFLSGGETTAELFDPSTESFNVTGSLNKPRSTSLWWSGAPLLANSKVLIIGGRTGSAELYDPATGTFSLTGSMDSRHSAATVTVLSNGKVLVAGGSLYIDTTEIYDPATGTFVSGNNMNSTRQQHTATRLLNGDVLIVGGAVDVDTPSTNTAEIFH